MYTVIYLCISSHTYIFQIIPTSHVSYNSIINFRMLSLTRYFVDDKRGNIFKTSCITNQNCFFIKQITMIYVHCFRWLSVWSRNKKMLCCRIHRHGLWQGCRIIIGPQLLWATNQMFSLNFKNMFSKIDSCSQNDSILLKT